MRRGGLWIILAQLMLLSSLLSMAQTSDVGAIGKIALSSKFGRFWNGKLEQELRMNDNFTSLDRSTTSVAVDYVLIRDLLKIKVDYDLIYKKQINFYELRQRAGVSLSSSYKLNSFTFKFRTRGQSTYRDEERGEYKFNPKLVWRNRLECAYNIFGSRFKPFASVELSCPIKSPHDLYLDGVRTIVGTKFRVSKHVSTEYFLRYDQEVQQTNPNSVVYAGFGWTYKL